MKFTILRLLTHSELGVFHEYRRSGREGSKQRAINFDWDVVDRVFPAAKDSDRIAVTCRCFEDAESVVLKDQWLKKQDKNWRLEGYCPTSPYYGFVEPGVLFAMVVDASNSPASASWVVVPMEHPARAAIINHGESSRLNKSAMIALYGDEGDFCRQILADHFPQLFEKVDSVMTSPVRTPGEAPPDPLGLFKILARAGHSLPSAVADLVDNSLSKGATEIDITFPNPNLGGRWMCIRDNGVGMTPDGLHDAMTIGHQREYDASDLGKYGYGLKGAAWSQADRLTVVSKAAESPSSVLTWDKDHLARTRRWELLQDAVPREYAEAVRLVGPGTAVLLTQMRPPIQPPKVSKGVEPYAQEAASIRDHLELVFHRYLEGDVRGRPLVKIRLNELDLRPNNPMGHSLTKRYDPRSIELLGHADPAKRPIVTVRAYVTPNEAEFNEFHKNLPPAELREQRDRLTLNGRANDSQGFYFYRLDRLIKWGGWEDIFAKDEHTKLLRVAVDFDRLADDVLQVDISKQVIRLPMALSDNLREILKAPRTEARNRYDRKVKAAGTGSGSAPGGISTGTGTATGSSGTKTVTTVGSGPKPAPKPGNKERSPLRLVEGGSMPWERKTGFAGEHVEITDQIPELVSLVRAIETNQDAKKALSDFLCALEKAGVVALLAGTTDAN